MSASSTPTTTRLCASWATVEANAPARSPKPRTSPSPTRPVAWWRSITAILARSRAGSATTRAVRDGRLGLARARDQLPGIDLDHAHPRRSSAMREASIGERRGAHRVRTQSRSARANGPARPSAATRAPSLNTRHGRKSSGRRAARGRRVARGRSRRGRAARAPAPRAAWPSRSTSSAATPSRDRDPAHLVDVPLAVAASRARGRRCRTRSTSGPCSRTSGSRSRRLRALEASRISTHMPRRRFSSASSHVSPRGR